MVREVYSLYQYFSILNPEYVYWFINAYCGCWSNLPSSFYLSGFNKKFRIKVSYTHETYLFSTIRKEMFFEQGTPENLFKKCFSEYVVRERQIPLVLNSLVCNFIWHNLKYVKDFTNLVSQLIHTRKKCIKKFSSMFKIYLVAWCLQIGSSVFLTGNYMSGFKSVMCKMISTWESNGCTNISILYTL